MGVFTDFRFEWDGEEIVIPSNRMMGLVHTVETVIPPIMLAEMAGEIQRNPKSVRPGRIAEIYTAVMRYAGKNVTQEQVYEGLFGQPEKVYAAIVAIMALMEAITPESVKAEFTKAAAPGKANRQARRAAGRLSSKRSKSPVGRKPKAASA